MNKINNIYIKKVASNFAKALPYYKEKLEKIISKRNILSEEEIKERMIYEKNIKIIEDTFYSVVNQNKYDRVNEYFFEGKKLEPYETHIKEEVDRWLYYLAIELGVFSKSKGE